MDIAIVTGASSSLGLAISRRLIQLGFRVYGLGGDYKECSLQNVNFRPVPCDLADPVDLETACKRILDKEQGVYLLVNNAKYFGKQPFEGMSLADMERILKINLMCPLVLMRVFGESLCTLQGYVIQLGAPYAESSNGGAAGAASAGGLKWMGEQFFNEYRNSGIKVCHLSPEPNRARDARMRIRRGARPEASIDPEAIAQAIEQILQSPFGNIVTEMVIRPLRIDEPEHDPVWKIPYPDPQPIPYTVPREMIEAEEQLEEDEWKQQQQLKRKRRSSRKKAAKKQTEVTDSADRDKPEKPRAEKKEMPEKADESTEKQGKQRRRPRRKPRPPKVVVGFHEQRDSKSESQQESKKEQAKPEKQPKAEKPSPAKKTAKKAAKNAAGEKPRNATKKTAKKTTQPTAKKAVKKTAAKKATRKAAKKAVRKRAAKKAAKPAGKKEKPE